MHLQANIRAMFARAFWVGECNALGALHSNDSIRIEVSVTQYSLGHSDFDSLEDSRKGQSASIPTSDGVG
jgi:hypothetical protein